MAIFRFMILACAALLVPARSIAQDQHVVVEGATARTEIERILNADNLDTSQFEPREVVEIISGIERGRAPQDFWDAYRRHVQAWAQLALAVERAQRAQAESTLSGGTDEVASATAAIETTFSEVERIARRYGARLPAPPIDTRAIV